MPRTSVMMLPQTIFKSPFGGRKLVTPTLRIVPSVNPGSIQSAPFEKANKIHISNAMCEIVKRLMTLMRSCKCSRQGTPLYKSAMIGTLNVNCYWPAYSLFIVGVNQ